MRWTIRRCLVGGLCVLFATVGAGRAGAQADAAQTRLVTVGMDDASVCCQYAVSGGGRFVAFELVSPRGVFVRDLRTGTTERVDVGPGGVPANDVAEGGVAISRGGRYVAFWSDASNLVPHDGHDEDAFLRDRKLGTTTLLPISRFGGFGAIFVISGNGRYLAFGAVGHDNEAFRYDRMRHRLVRRTIGVDETEVVGISDDGASVLVWADGGPRLWKVASGHLVRFDQALDGSHANRDVDPDALSADGRLVLFTSAASNLVEGDTNRHADAFVRNVRTHTTRRISVAFDGGQAIGTSGGDGISANGRFVLFSSSATNLTPKDGNGRWDLFLRDRWRHTTRLCSVTWTGQQANHDVSTGQLSRNGAFAFFISSDPFAPGSSGQPDLYVRGPGC